MLHVIGVMRGSGAQTIIDRKHHSLKCYGASTSLTLSGTLETPSKYSHLWLHRLIAKERSTEYLKSLFLLLQEHKLVGERTSNEKYGVFRTFFVVRARSPT